MSWFTNTFKTSIGKKLIMAVTGLSFICFLMAHLAGNLTLYGGENAFNSYAERLHTFGPIITIVELGLLFLIIMHVLTGFILFYQNTLARPIRYKVYKKAGGAPDANAIPIHQKTAETAMDAAACIGCGACVASCPITNIARLNREFIKSGLF